MKLPHAKIIVFSSELIVAKAADFFVSTIKRLQENDKTLFILLSGGSAITVYQTAIPALEQLDLTGCAVGLADERLVPLSDEDSNWTQLEKSGVLAAFKQAGAKLIQPFEQLESGKTVAQKMNTQYKKAVADTDYVLVSLGIGEDGHTAGILPTKTPKKFEQQYGSDSVCYYQVDAQDSKNEHTHRVTITPTFFSKIDEVQLFAAGSNKQKPLKKMLGKKGRLHRTPARVLQEVAKVTILTDQEII